MKRRIYLSMKSLAEARELWLARFDLDAMAQAEEVPVTAAAGPGDRGAGHGQAVLAGGPPGGHGRFCGGRGRNLRGHAGPAEALALGREAFPINTGHVMPPGTDAVIMVEQVPDPEADPITVEAPTFPWQHVRRVGEDLVRGEMVLPEGVEITPWAQGALLAAGVTRVTVRRRPQVAIIPTGTELVPVTELDRDLPAGRLPEFNSTILAGLVAEAGGVAEVWPIVRDDPGALAAALKEAVARRGSGADQRRVLGGHRGLHLPGHRLPGGSAGARGRHDAGQTHGVGGGGGEAGHRQPGLSGVRGAVLRAVRGAPHRRPGGETPGPPAHPDGVSGPEPAVQAGPDGIHPGDPGRVGDKVMATPLPRGAGTITSLVRADGLLVVPALSEGLEEDRPVSAELLVAPADIDGTLVVLGSHDNTLDLLATLLRRRDHRLRLSSGHVGSLGGLMALRQGRAHLGGSHMLDPETNTYNVPFIQRYLAGVPLKLVNLAWREQGLMVAPGNPQGDQDHPGPDPSRGAVHQPPAGGRHPAPAGLPPQGSRACRPIRSRATSGRSTPTWPWR